MERTSHDMTMHFAGAHACIHTTYTEERAQISNHPLRLRHREHRGNTDDLLCDLYALYYALGC
jgi:hypothetical protein